jgi:tetratricopeptide (TPR) repeat protein
LMTIPGINSQRNQYPNELRMAKAGSLCRVQPASIVMGTSRVELGIDPKHAGWNRALGPVYNLAMPGMGLHELLLTFIHAVHVSPRLHTALIGLDFDMFNANREAVIFGTEVAGFDEHRLLLSDHDTCWRAFFYDVNSYLGLRGLYSSFVTVIKQMPEGDRDNATKAAETSCAECATWLSLSDPDGFRDGGHVFQMLAKIGGYRALFGSVQEPYYVSSIWRPAPDRRYCFAREGRPNTFDEFRELIQFARKSGIDLRLFIAPIHARLLLALQEAGLWPQYEDWKRGLVDLLAEEARESSGSAFPLWDFSGFNSVTAEPVPAAGDIKTEVRWFWEPSHFKKEAGDLILDRVLGYQESSRKIPEDFGIPLSQSNVEVWLAQSREAGRTYVNREIEDAQLVRKLVAKALANSTGSNCGFEWQALREGIRALRQGDKIAAEASFSRAIAIHEGDRRRFAELGVPQRESGFEAALQRARAGEKQVANLGDWRDYQSRGMERVDRGDVLGAIEDYTRAIHTGPPNAALHFLRGTARLRVPDFSGAIEDFEAGLKLDPMNSSLKQLLERARQSLAQVNASPPSAPPSQLRP